VPAPPVATTLTSRLYPNDLIEPALAIHAAHSLAQAPPASTGNGAGAVVLWGAVMIVIILVGGLVVFQLRKRLLESEGGGNDDPFGLQELRDLKKSGQISEQEYQTLRAKVIDQVKGALSEDNAADEPAAPPKASARPRRDSPRSDGFDQR